MAAEELRQLNLSNGDATAMNQELTEPQIAQSSGQDENLHDVSSAPQAPNKVNSAVDQPEQYNALTQRFEALRT